MIQRDLVTLPEMLQQNDYFTGVVGKYHVGMDFDDGHGNPADEFDYKDVDFTKKSWMDRLITALMNSLEYLEIPKIHWIRNPEFLFVMTAGLLLNGKNEMDRHSTSIRANFECT